MRSSELERERQPVDRAADPRHRGRIDGSDLVARPHRRRPRNEERDGFVPGERLDVPLDLGAWNGKRWHRILVLARHVEDGATRDEHLQPRSGRENLRHQRRRLVDVFEVVQQEQHSCVTERALQRVEG